VEELGERTQRLEHHFRLNFLEEGREGVLMGRVIVRLASDKKRLPGHRRGVSGNASKIFPSPKRKGGFNKKSRGVEQRSAFLLPYLGSG